MQKRININMDLPLEQFNVLKKGINIKKIKISYDVYEDLISININIPNLNTICIKAGNMDKLIPLNEEITAELCTPQECLSPGRNMLSPDILEQVIKADDYISLRSELVKIIGAVIDPTYYVIHLGTSTFELLMPFLTKCIDKKDNDSIYYTIDISELKKVKFVINEEIEPALAIVKRNYKERLWTSSLAKD